jgi:transposase
MHYETRFRTRLKILFFDGTGLWVCTKRLEEGSFSWPRSVDVQSNKIHLTPEALSMLTDGVDLRGAKMRPWYEREA